MPLKLDTDGVAAGIRFLPSPNCDARPAGAALSSLVIHNISLPPGEFGGDGISDLFINRLDPSAHPYYATIAQPQGVGAFSRAPRRRADPVRALAKRAWHAGESAWRGRAAATTSRSASSSKAPTTAVSRYSVCSARATHSRLAARLWRARHRRPFGYCPRA